MICAVIRKSRLRQWLIPGLSLGVSRTLERKKEAWRASTGHSTPAFAICLNERRHVVLLGVAVLGADEGDPIVHVAELIDLEPFGRPDPGNRHGLQGEDDRALWEGM